MYPTLSDIAELTTAEQRRFHDWMNEKLAVQMASHTNSLKIQEAKQKLELGEEQCH